MERVTFKMQLHKGFEEEYKKRHDKIWPDLKKLLKDSGIAEYSICLDETTNGLFVFLKVIDSKILDKLPEQEVMQGWWKYRKDIMDSNPDYSPGRIKLNEVFYLP